MTYKSLTLLPPFESDKQPQALACYISPLGFDEQHETAFEQHAEGGHGNVSAAEFKDWRDGKYYSVCRYQI